MGALPAVDLPRDYVPVGDSKVEVRGLSRAEALRLTGGNYRGDPDGGEVYVLVCGTGVTDEEAAAWRQATPSAVVDAVVDRILELSGLIEGASKSGGPRADDGDG